MLRQIATTFLILSYAREDAIILVIASVRNLETFSKLVTE